jgi:hypothetical protein
VLILNEEITAPESARPAIAAVPDHQVTPAVEKVIEANTVALGSVTQLIMEGVAHHAAPSTAG